MENKIEEVKKILKEEVGTFDSDSHTYLNDETRIYLAKKISQLFPQPLDGRKLSRKAFLALPLEERRRLLGEQLMLMDEQDREAIRDLHKLD